MKLTVTFLILLVLLSPNSDAITVEHQRSLIGHTQMVTSVAFSPDGRTLVTGYTEAITDIAFSPDGEVLASGSEDETAQLWKITE